MARTNVACISSNWYVGDCFIAPNYNTNRRLVVIRRTTGGAGGYSDQAALVGGHCICGRYRTGFSLPLGEFSTARYAPS